ncbi:zinc ABC transporter substrate-binding protein [Atopomonas sediminilitoris]|uniref:zinc ABC transporter substrate-binding protein n=1 Tax=Atopomonas sediminilitoris TaxID=2919919 RepID=UPI001F4EEC36|nr:zinc ABC transporter substrate-binding protein [Atopomonas sediminilitoris]MCJ8170496.1 zinc ABC transporter substrate-binding protein [Atopomonas sediminilitoris]
MFSALRPAPRYLVATFLTACLTACLSATSAFAAPTVLTSIKPLQLIADAVLSEQGSAEVLLAPGASPHQYSLRPSEMRQIQQADLLYWVGPELESFLPKVLAQRSQPNVALLHAQGMQLKHFDQAHADDDHAGHDHHADSLDPHFWLDPRNAKQIAKRMAEDFSRFDSEHAAHYAANAERFAQAVDAADRQLKQRLAKLKDQPYLVFHQAYDYFEAHQGLHNQGVFTFTPEVQPGARHLNELRERLRAVGNACIFSEPPLVPRTLHSLAKDLPVRFGQLDPLGQASASYVAMYLDLGNALADCLERL